MIKQLLESEIWVDGDVIKQRRGENDRYRWLTLICEDGSLLSLTESKEVELYEMSVHTDWDSVVLTMSNVQLARALNIGWDLEHVAEWKMALDLSELLSALIYHDLVGKAHIAYTEEEEGLKLRHNRFEREGNVVLRVLSGKEEGDAGDC